MTSNDIIEKLFNNGFNKILRKPAATNIQKDRPTYDDALDSEIEYNSNVNAIFASKIATFISSDSAIIYDANLDTNVDVKIFINGVFWGVVEIIENTSANNIVIKFFDLPYELTPDDEIEVQAYFKK